MRKQDIYYIAFCIGIIVIIWGLAQTVAGQYTDQERIDILRENECNTGNMRYDQRCHEYYNQMEL